MADINTILSIISTVGFPIAVCIMLMWYVMKIQEKHDIETKSFTDALNKNTLVLQKLCDKLNIKGVDVDD